MRRLTQAIIVLVLATISSCKDSEIEEVNNVEYIEDGKIKVFSQCKCSHGDDEVLLRNQVVAIEDGEEVGFDFHSVVWVKLISGKEVEHLVLNRKDFITNPNMELWVADIGKFDSVTGNIIARFGQEKPGEGDYTKTVEYSWREWNLNQNKEVRFLYVCEDIFDKYDESKVEN